MAKCELYHSLQGWPAKAVAGCPWLRKAWPTHGADGCFWFWVGSIHTSGLQECYQRLTITSKTTLHVNFGVVTVDGTEEGFGRLE